MMQEERTLKDMAATEAAHVPNTMEEAEKPVAGIFIDCRPVADCRNSDSMGEICVKCNECGRFSEQAEPNSDPAGQGLHLA